MRLWSPRHCGCDVGSEQAGTAIICAWSVISLAAPEGVEAFACAHPDVPIFAAAADRQRNDYDGILPGLGDAGDRMFSAK